jgi:hypothetical protein
VRYGRFGIVFLKITFLLCLELKRVETCSDGDMGSGGGWVGGVEIDAADQRGSNGTSWSWAVAVLSDDMVLFLKITFFLCLELNRVATAAWGVGVGGWG